MSLVKMDSFRKANGKIDWRALHQAQIDNGENCQKCHGHIMFSRGHPALCHQCRKAGGTEEFWHDSFLRCPKCGHLWDPMACENYDLLADGDHDAHCCECGHNFEMATSVSFSFRSPKRIQEEENEPETVQKTEHGKD